MDIHTILQKASEIILVCQCESGIGFCLAVSESTVTYIFLKVMPCNIIHDIIIILCSVDLDISIGTGIAIYFQSFVALF